MSGGIPIQFPGMVPGSNKSKPRSYIAVIERCSDMGLYVGYVPGIPGAHSQGATRDELNDNLREVVSMILDDGIPSMASEFVGTQVVVVA